MEALEKAKESGDIEDNDPEQNGNNHNSNQ